MALRIEFYESGVGETIVLTFPGGGLGVVDACPGISGAREPIEKLVRGKKVHFVCLSHPHHDHAEDLEGALDAACDGVAPKDRPTFWHTVSDVNTLLYSLEDEKIHKSPLREAIRELRVGSARCLIRTYGKVATYQLPVETLQAGLQSFKIDGVTVHVLGPEQQERHAFTRAYREILQGERKNTPNPNSLSAILALEYGGGVLILGADALKRNWNAAFTRWKVAGLAPASLLKTPHHGARNAMNLQNGSRQRNYLDLCAKDGSTKAILFSGDRKHPDAAVARRLAASCETICTANGLKNRGGLPAPNSLGLLLAEAQETGATGASTVCNPVVAYEISENGRLILLKGQRCLGCPGA